MDADGERLYLAGQGRPLRDYGFGITVDELASIAATDLRHALSTADEYTPHLLVCPGEAAWLYEDTVATTGVEFGVDNGHLVDVAVTLEEYFDSENDLEISLRGLLGELLARRNAQLLTASYSADYVGPPPYPATVTLLPATRGRTLEDLHEIGRDVIALSDASTGTALALAPTLDLLRAGRADTLIGQPEGPWLDVKKQLYDISSTAGKISLAQAVARFANGDDGGLIVFGLAARKTGSGEVVAKLQPVRTDNKAVRRHQQALEQHLYPLPVGLRIETVPAADGRLLLVYLPPQPQGVKPFLVHGAIVDGRVEGAFISIVRRHGEDSIPITAPAVHSAMSVNRLLDRLKPHTQHRSSPLPRPGVRRPKHR